MKKIDDIPDNNLNLLISNLENELSKLKLDGKGLESDIIKLKKQESRYYNLFKNSTVAIWEEDFSEAYRVLKKLPCHTKEEYTVYLDKNPKILQELIDKIKILDINQSAVELFNAAKKEDILESLDKIFIQESYNTLRDQFITIAVGDFSYECETMGRRFNGEEFHIMLSAFFPDKHGKSVFITMVEITNRIKKEKEQDIILQKIVEQKKNADILIDITFALASKTDKNDILDSILEQIEKIVPYSSANIMLIKDETFTVARHRGYDKFGAANFMTQFAEKIASERIAPTLLNGKQIRIIDDTKSYPNWKQFPETKYISSLLSIPINWQGTTLGVLNLDSNRKHTFSNKDAIKLKPIIYAAAISIQKARLFEQINKDIAERKITEENLRMALKEKDLLLQEIHHRVKNNLTIIIALINLQDTKLTNPSEIELFEELNQRIHSIALVHEKLYENHNLANIDFYSYTTDLIISIQAVLIYRSDIKFNTDIPHDIYFGLDTLIPLGLILNELITNSLKYAFKDSGGEISVSLVESKIDNCSTITIKDNGTGYPQNVINGNNEQLGLLLVNSLTSQINGSVNYFNKNGAVVTINIPTAENTNG